MIIFALIEINKGIEIEAPIVKCEGYEITTVKSTFVNSDLLKSNNNYEIDVDAVIDNLIPSQVKPGEKLDIEVKSNPRYFLLVQRQRDGNYEEIAQSLTEEKNTCSITAPKEEGEYIYSISVEYKAGLGIYYFSLQVSSGN